MSIPPIIDPPDEPPPGPGGFPQPTYVPGLAGNLVQRYACNLVVSEEMKVVDLLHEVIFPSARMFMSQGANGKIRLHSKRPVDWAMVEDALAVQDSDLNLDDISPWVNNFNSYLLIDPYTDRSETRSVTDAYYSLLQDVVTLSVTATMTKTNFTGRTNTTPATATVTVNSVNTSGTESVTLDGIVVSFNAGTGDTTTTIAAFLAATINAHPKLYRRFRATAATNIVTITAKFGTIEIGPGVSVAHSGPVANPSVAPTLTATASGTFPAGVYKVAYSYVNDRGQTLLSPVRSVTLTANQKITVTGITPPADTTVNWYVTPEAASKKIRLHSNNDGSGFVIDRLPLLSDTLPPEINRTGCEVMRVQAIFSDRLEPRAAFKRSNVLRATYEWILGNRQKSVNRVDLKYRDNLQDFRLIELRLADRDSIEKVKKVNNVEINGQAIDNEYQAYRIASSILAERQDSDFFYNWTSTREALLLEEGDVVAITDDGSGVINLPMMIQGIELDASGAGLPKVSFTGQKYYTTLYDDSIAERKMRIVVEPKIDYVPVPPDVTPPSVPVVDVFVVDSYDALTLSWLASSDA